MSDVKRSSIASILFWIVLFSGIIYGSCSLALLLNMEAIGGGTKTM